MSSAPIPPNESERLAALRDFGILDTPPDPDFDNLTRLASEICETPMAMISLVDNERQWFKSKVGVTNDADPRAVSFCAHAFGSAELLVVPDATADARFADNPLVTGEPLIRFYAGAPLVDRGGHVLGTLCVVDHQPRQLSPSQTKSLETLRDQVMILMKFNRQTREMQQSNDSLLSILEDQTLVEKQLRSSEETLRQKEVLLRMVGRLATIGGWSIEMPEFKVTWSEEMFAILGYTGAGQTPTFKEGMALFEPTTRARVTAAINRSAESKENFEMEEQMGTLDHRTIWVQITGEAEVNSDGVVTAVRGALQDISARKLAEQEIKYVNEQLLMSGRLARVGAWYVDIGSDEVHWSQMVRQIHGVLTDRKITVEEGIDFYTEESRPVITKLFHECVEQGTPFLVDLQIKNVAGEKIWISTSGEPVRNAQGKIVRVQGAFQQIDESKKAQIALVQSRKNLQGVNQVLQEVSVQNLSLDETIKLIADRANKICGGQGSAVELLRAGKLFVQYAAGIMAHSMSIEFEPSGTFSGLCLESPKALVANDAQHDDRVCQKTMRKIRAHSVMVAPVRERDQNIGVLKVVADRPNAFTEEAAGNLQILAESLASVIQRNWFTEKLRASEQQYRLLFASNPLPMWTYDISSLRFLDVNNAAVQHYGYSREEFLTMTVLDIRAPEDPSEFNSAVSKMKSAGGMFGLRVHEKKSGELIEAEVSSEPVTFNGRSARLALVNDVTEKRRNEARLQEQAALIDAAPIAIIVQDLNNRIRFWSEGAVQLYGWSKTEALGKTLQELLKPDANLYAEACQSVRKKGQWTGEVKKINKAEQDLTVSALWKLQHSQHGEPESILTIDLNITDSKKLEQQFLRAQRMESIGTLAGGIAHDLNNLLAPIVMGVELLRMNTPSLDKGPVIDNIERSAKRGADLVKQVLSFARGVEGARIAIKLHHIIREIEQLIESTFPKNIESHAHLSKDLPMVMGDPTQLHQVFLNMAVNARDAMPHGGEITFSASAVEIDQQYAAMNQGVKAGSYVCLDVSDTGTGMPPEMIERIFEPFFTTKELGKGTGLGLSTAIGIVRSHGGFINVYSELGRGTSFKIYLPVQPHETSGNTPELFPHESMNRGKGETVLVVDDETSILSITKQTLEAFGYEVMTAEDGAEAISLYAVNQQKIRVVLTDMMMPVMDGPALIAALKRINPEVLIIAASGLKNKGNVAKAEESGSKYFLPKPFTAESLLQMLTKVLGN